MENEIWRDIPEYEGLYQVSNFGRVKSLERFRKNCYGAISIVRMRILKAKLDTDGYAIHGLSKNGKVKTFKLHTLVAKCFLQNTNPSIFNQINHIDGDKLNNKPENLEWCDHTYNQRHAVTLGLKGGKPYKPRINSSRISQFKDGILIKTYENLAQASRESRIKNTAIGNCLAGRSKSSGGYQWKYAD